MNPLITDSALSDSRKPVIVALDFADEASTIQFVRRLDPSLCRLKIGKELFTATGRRLAENLIHQGYQLFLDLKYHDIPNTVAKACKAAAEMGVWMVDMHAYGGCRGSGSKLSGQAAFNRRYRADQHGAGRLGRNGRGCAD